MYEKSDNILEIMILKTMYKRIKNSQDFQYLTHVETKSSGTDSSFTGHKDRCGGRKSLSRLWCEDICFTGLGKA